MSATDPTPGPLSPEREAAKARVRAKVATDKAMPARERIYHLLCATHTHAEAEAMLAEVEGNSSAELEASPTIADVAAWLRKKAREYASTRERQESAADAIARLADKVSRGAIRPAPELTVYRASHDSIVMGLYTTAAEARKHCEAEERRAWPRGGKDLAIDWIEDEEDGVAEMTVWIGGEECASGYVVTPLEVASEYDEECDE